MSLCGIDYYYMKDGEDPELSLQKYSEEDVTPAILETAKNLFYAFQERFEDGPDYDTWEAYQERHRFYLGEEEKKEANWFCLLAFALQISIVSPEVWRSWCSWGSKIEVMTAAAFNYHITDSGAMWGNRYSWWYQWKWFHSPTTPDIVKERLRERFNWWRRIVREAQMNEFEDVIS